MDQPSLLTVPLTSATTLNAALRSSAKSEGEAMNTFKTPRICRGPAIAVWVTSPWQHGIANAASGLAIPRVPMPRLVLRREGSHLALSRILVPKRPSRRLLPNFPALALPSSHQEHRHLRDQIRQKLPLAMTRQEVAPLHYQQFQLRQRFEIVHRQEWNTRTHRQIARELSRAALLEG